ncbi:hypothetical protein WISP_111578 [Willisornis vidua]|uniref:Uncharacterized protein n=1 Tax=Willisornis vidua TaxID=1566151 RepID=A0ABQ9D0L9_9PASS|nr:hypothetical protein WISP_111578 [Willisornis vidua]
MILGNQHKVHFPPLDMLQHLNVLLAVRGPELEKHSRCSLTSAKYRGMDNPFPSPAGHTVLDTGQDVFVLLGHLDIWSWAHVQLAFDQQPQDPAAGLVEPHTLGLSLSIQSFQTPLQSLPIYHQINIPTQQGVICELTDGALGPFIYIINKDVKMDSFKY